MRIRAALDAFDRAGIDTNVEAVDGVLAHSFGEVRPFEFNAAVARATTLADQTPDPQLAALIAVAALSPSPPFIRLANLRGLASDGSVLVGPWGGALAIPPELRGFLATWHRELASIADVQLIPLFPGNSHRRVSEPAIRRRLAALNAPASLWEDPPDTTIGDDANADGRVLLHHLTAWHLWLQRRHEKAQSTPA